MPWPVVLETPAQELHQIDWSAISPLLHGSLTPSGCSQSHTVETCGFSRIAGSTFPQSISRRSLNLALPLGSSRGIPVQHSNRFEISIEIMDWRASHRIHHRLPPGLPSLSPGEWLCVYDGIEGVKYYTLSELQAAKVLAGIENVVLTNGVTLDAR